MHVPLALVLAGTCLCSVVQGTFFLPNPPRPRPAILTYPRQAQHADEARQLMSLANSTTKPEAWLEKLTSYHTRDHRTPTGKEAADWLYSEIKSTVEANSDVRVKLHFAPNENQPSIIAQIPGTSPDLVILGCHIDSAGETREGLAPGADDDGSGTVVVMETLRILAQEQFRPTATLEFHFYAAEEDGLIGSDAIFAQYKAESQRVLAMLQQDMAGYSPSGTMSVITDRVHGGLTDYVKALVAEFSGKAPTTDTCGYACSDHTSASKHGFPSAYVAEDTTSKSNPWIHTANDTMEAIEWPTVLRHIKFSVAFMVEASYLRRP